MSQSLNVLVCLIKKENDENLPFVGLLRRSQRAIAPSLEAVANRSVTQNTSALSCVDEQMPLTDLDYEDQR